jgi:hypothetical protein
MILISENDLKKRNAVDKSTLKNYFIESASFGHGSIH